MKKIIKFGLYEQANIGDGSGAASLWTHPEDKRIESVKSFDYWLRIARLAEEINLDLLFFGDVSGIYDTYKNSPATAISWGVELPAHDPLMILPALASATRNLAFGVTISTSYDHPFAHARRMSTLDHLTGGRIGWNIVTSYLPGAARNFGLSQMRPHDERYAMAEEFLEVAYKLWEGSWASDAFAGSKEQRLFARPDRVRTIDHQGHFVSCSGPNVSFPSPQRTPLLIQAGWSPRGKSFGARHAEVVFVGDSDPQAVQKGLEDIRRLAIADGRDPRQIKALTGLQIVVAESRAAAEDKLNDYQQYYEPEASLAAYSGWSGIDIAAYQDDEPLNKTSNHTQSTAEKAPLLAGDVKKRYARVDGNSGLTFTGTPQDIADQIEDYVDQSGIDGFLLHQFISPGSFEDFASLVVPELIRRGRYRTTPHSGTLRSRLRDDSSDRLPADHPAARYRW